MIVNATKRPSGPGLVQRLCHLGRGQAAEAGATAAIQPGGSVKDPEVIAAANERGVAMVFTGARHFRH